MNSFISRHPPAVLTLGFVALIALGAALLLLPFAAKHPITLIQAAFTATSAVTVTGLGVVDTTEYTLFGQIVIMILIQLGGLGFMTIAVLALMSLQRQLGMASQMAAQEALGQVSFNKIADTARSVIKFTLLFEGAGFLIYTLYWWPETGLLRAAYQGLFYAISAFNNAGFALDANSLQPYASSVTINLTTTFLIIVGGIGFIVLMDIRDCGFSWKKFSVNTKVVLTATLGLNLVGFVVMWALEYRNPYTLGHMSAGDQALAAWFQAISPRTAGFFTIPIGSMTDASTFFMILLMVIGGGSLSTASGLKVGTFVVLLLTTWSFLRQHEQVTLFNRTIPERQVKKAQALAIITAIMLIGSVMILLVIEQHHEYLDILFEVVSALSTVGLTRGITPELSTLGQMVLIVMMLAGRLGPLTLAYFIALPKKRRVKFAETSILVG